MPLNFVAIDFETANSSPASACEIGVVVVEDSQIVDSFGLLIRPRDNWFHFFNTKLHGIDAKRVENEPEFDEIWETLEPVFEGKNLIAHNAGFDMGVLRSVLEAYQLEFPKFRYACSVQISRKAWPSLGTYKLNVVSDHLNISLDHHHALDDSIASAKIVLQAAKENGVTKFEDLKNVFSIHIHEFKQKPLRFPTYKAKPSLTEISFDRNKVDQGSIYYQKCVVFTGKLSHFVRKEAQKKVLEIGGICSMEVDNRIDYLVIGQKDFFKFQQGTRSSKSRQAEELQNYGHRVEIISEEEFLKNIGWEKSSGGLFD